MSRHRSRVRSSSKMRTRWTPTLGYSRSVTNFGLCLLSMIWGSGWDPADPRIAAIRRRLPDPSEHRLRSFLGGHPVPPAVDRFAEGEGFSSLHREDRTFRTELEIDRLAVGQDRGEIPKDLIRRHVRSDDLPARMHEARPSLVAGSRRQN